MMISNQHNYSNVLKWIMLIIMGVWIRTAFANPDVVAQNYSAAQSAGLNSCTSGYDLLAGDVQYGKQQITGALPYNLVYSAPLRQNITAAQTFIDNWSSNSGWTDNYQSHITTKAYKITTTKYSNPDLVYNQNVKGYFNPVINWLNPPQTTASGFNVLYIRLPGERADTLFRVCRHKI